MRRFLAKHPLWTSVVIGLAACATCILWWPITDAVHLPLAVSREVPWGGVVIVPPVVYSALGLAASLLRRRSGLSSRPLWALPVLAGALTLVVSACWWVSLLVIVGAEPLVPALAGLLASEEIYEIAASSPSAIWVAPISGVTGFWHIEPFFYSTAASVVGTLATVLIGLGIARWKLRTGRWEHIVPVERPRG